MKELDPWDLALHGTTLIEASAGTGKTYTLTTLYVRLLVEQDLSPDEILVVTYTQAATAELRTRVRERILETIAAGESADSAESEKVDPRLRELAIRARAKAAGPSGLDPLRRALQDFDEAAIFTIHGFCQRTLQRNAFESGIAFDAELIETPKLLERTLAHDLWARLLEAEDDVFREWLEEGDGRRWEFEPDRIERTLLRELGADDEMPVLPSLGDSDPGPPPDLASLRKAVTDAWPRWRESWASRGDSLGGILIGNPALNKGTYSEKSVGGTWLPELAELAARFDETRTETARGTDGDEACVSISLPGFWAKLTPTGLAEKTNKGKETPADPFFEACAVLGDAVAALNAAYDQRALALRLRFVMAAREEADRRRTERHLLYFDDLLSALRSALRPPGGDRLAELLREQYRFALIDEFQDTDPVQYEIFETVWHSFRERSRDRSPESPAASRGPGGLVLIGDPKQAIYSFRGADVYTYLRARDDAAESSYGLGVNRRSDPGLIRAVNTLFSGPAEAFGVGEIEFHPVAPRPDAAPGLRAPNRSEAGMRVLFVGRDAASEIAGEDFKTNIKLAFARTDGMRAFARDIADLLDSGAEIDGRPVQPSDIAVLCRRKLELAYAKRALEGLGIPCVDRGDDDVFDSTEAWELASVLRAWLRPADPATLRGALSTAAHGLGAPALASLVDDSPELAEISERFSEYARIWTQSGFSRAFETWRRREGVSATLLTLQDGERRLTNWLHLGELLQRVASEHVSSKSGLIAWLERAIADTDARVEIGSDASLLRLERDDQAVSLITLHRSKGLEYPIVYLPSLWEDPSSRDVSVQSAKDSTKKHPPIRFHDKTSGRRTLDLGLPGEAYVAHVEQKEDETISEQLRLLYVGLTRARHQCVVVWGAIYTGHRKSPLAWLLHGRAWQKEERESGKPRSKFPDSLSKCDDARWRKAWHDVADAAGEGAISIEDANFDSRSRWSAPAIERPSLEFEAPRRPLGRPFVTTSFSALVRDAQRGGPTQSGPLVTGRDLDALVERETLADPIETPDLAADMHNFPRGAVAGTLLHEVLEGIDFSAYDPRDAEEAVRERAMDALARGRFDATLADQVVHVVDSVARTPLRADPRPFRLADVASGQLRPEMEFTLSAPGSPHGEAFSPASLAGLLAKAPAGSSLERYASRAAAMSWRELSGYLRGFIDAVFFDGGRYYLIDYKSNHLGARQADYQPDQLAQPMIDHDYVLQYLIYTVALDRHLVRRLAGYDYDEHFGGAYYLFLRGLAVSHAPGCGVFFDRPPAELVRAVSALLGDSRGLAA